MDTIAWILLLYMGGASHGGPVAVPMASEVACRAAYAAMVEEAAERSRRVVEEKRGEGTGPSFSYRRCFDGATGKMVALDRR